jgi:hypothetical protein
VQVQVQALLHYAGRKFPAQLHEGDDHSWDACPAINGLDRDSKSVGFHVTGFQRKFVPEEGYPLARLVKGLAWNGGCTTGCYRRLLKFKAFKGA